MAIIQVNARCSTIQAAVDAALPGDEIFVEDGVYHEQVAVDKNFIRIVGGKKTVLDGEWKLDTAFTLNNTRGVEICSFIIKNYKSDGVDILGKGLSNTVTGTHLINIGVNGFMQDTSAADSRIIGCSVSSADAGVYDAGYCMLVEACRILYCRAGVYCTKSSANAIVKGCDLSRNMTGTSIYGVFTLLKMNKVYESRDVGIYVDGYNCLLEENDVNGSLSYDGIHIHITGRGNTVRGNRVHSGGRYGIYVGSYNSVLDNEVNENTSIGIFIDGRGNIIRDNKAAGNGRFDIARVSARNIVSGNVCGESLPPWLCKECTEVEPEVPDSAGETEPCVIADLRVPADYPTVQQAVDAASPGDMISVGSGVYHEQVTVNKNCLKIIGEEGAVLDGKGRLDSGFTLEGTSGVEIRSFRIQNYRLNGVSVLGGGENTVSGTSISNIINYGIDLDTATINNRICNSRIEGAYNGIFDSSSNLRIENSWMSFNGNYGIYGRGSSTKIIKSEVENNIGGGVVHIGSGVRITECRISRNMYDGISVQDDCIIENCEACFNARHGIELNRGNNLVKNNLLSSNEMYGIYSAMGNSIIGNRADNNKLYGIYVTDNNYVQNNTAHGNTIYDIVRNGINSLFHDNHCGSCLPPWICGGVLTPQKIERRRDAEEVAVTIVVPDDYPTIQGAVDAAMHGDVILVKNGTYSEQVTIVQDSIKILGEEQTVLDGGKVLEHGFIVSNTFDVEIRSFTVLNYTSYGISVTENSHEIVLSDISAMNCYYGIYLSSGTSNCRITGCSVIGNGHIGIYGLTDNLVIEDCDISYNASGAIVTDCSTSAVRRNAIHNNLGYGIKNQVNNNAVITGNRLYENQGTCLAAHGFSVIRENEVSNNYSKGISANRNSIVEGNLSVGNSGAGITANGECCVKSNDVQDNQGFGLAVYYAGNVVARNTAVHNKDYDIVVNQSGNWICGNTCGKSVPPWVCGECQADQGDQPEVSEDDEYEQD